MATTLKEWPDRYPDPLVGYVGFSGVEADGEVGCYECGQLMAPSQTGLCGTCRHSHKWERIERMRTMAATGATAGEIGREFGVKAKTVNNLFTEARRAGMNVPRGRWERRP
jgi:hypothetical protein